MKISSRMLIKQEIVEHEDSTLLGELGFMSLVSLLIMKP